MDDYFAGSVTARPGSDGPPQQEWAPAPAPPPSAPAPQAWQAQQAWPYPQQPVWQYAPPPQGMSRGLKVLLGLGIGLGALVVLAILAAIAIPVFLDQRAKALAARTTVSLPDRVGAMVRLGTPQAAAIEARLAGIPGPGTHLAGVFGTGGTVQLAVGVTRRASTGADQQAYLRGSERGLDAVAGTTVAFADENPGTLGGSLRCGVMTPPGGSATVCFFVDAAAYGSVIVYNGSGDAVAVARQAREAVEHRS